MKIKLLKKIRKRFSIIHYPEGFRNGSDYYNYNLFELKDDSNSYWSKYAQVEDGKSDMFTTSIFKTEKECIDYLKQVIITRLRDEGHKGRKDRIIIGRQIKVWYGK